jgi:hypothetical protein
VLQELESLAAKEQPAIEKLTVQLRTLLDHIAKHAQIHKLLFEDDAVHGLLQTSERRRIEVASQRLAKIFHQGITEGVFRPSDPLLLARMYLGLCKGVLQNQPELERHDQRENLCRLIIGTFLNGITTENRQTIFGGNGASERAEKAFSLGQPASSVGAYQ